MAKETAVEVKIEDRVLKLTNLEKVLYPEVGFTKAQVIDYYTRMAPVILPHTRDHPLTLKRYPNGVDAEFFYEKNCPKHRPPWVETATVWSGGNNRDMYYCLCQDLPTLVWLAQIATLEFHTSLSYAANLPEPRTMVFDLDPGPPATIVECCRIGLMLRDVFAEHGLECCAKTSGSKGLQLYVPLNTKVTYVETKVVSKGLAQLFEERHPDLVVHKQLKELRTGRVLIDWSQNDQYKTTVNVYSLARAPAADRVDAGVVGRGREVPQGRRPQPPGLRLRPGPGARRQARRPVRAGAQEEAEAAQIARRGDWRSRRAGEDGQPPSQHRGTRPASHPRSDPAAGRDRGRGLWRPHLRAGR